MKEHAIRQHSLGIYPVQHTFTLHLQKENHMKNINTNNSQLSASTSVRRIKGQGLTEYVVIVSLIAIASIVAVSAFGSSVKASFLSLGTDLVGGETVDRAAVAQENLTAADDKARAKVTLKDYNQ